MDALAAQVTRLVETVFLRSRLVNLDDDPKEGALRRCTPCREVESRPLVRRLLPEPQDPHRHAHVERAPAARPCHLEQRGTGPADLTLEDAVIQGLEPRAPPPRTCKKESCGETYEANAGLGERARGERERHDPE